VKIIAIINQKGGVGKSTTAMAIGAGLSFKGYRVLCIDLDAQGNLSNTMGIDSTSMTCYSSMNVLNDNITAEQAIQHTKQGDIIASSPALSAADTVITELNKEYRLREALVPVHNNYDYAIIDTPPALGILTVNALVAATDCLIPAQADVYSLHGINQLYRTIQLVKTYCNPQLNIMGILLTRYTGRTVISRDVSKMMAQTAGQIETKLYSTRIRECTAVKEAQAVRQNIFTYAKRSNAAKDYNALIIEILKEENQAHGKKR